MSNHFWITGTDTDVGKTLVTTYFMHYFQSKGENVIPYKPIQTGLIVEGSRAYYGDTEFYQTFSANTLVKEDLNSYSFVEPASPHYAARLEGAKINEEVILQHIEQLKPKYDRVICEGAGGLYVPINEQRNYHFLNLIKQSQLPAVVVARTKLGTINHTLLTLEALKINDVPVAGIVFNAFEDTELERDNIQTIQQLTNLPTLVIPKLTNLADFKTIEISNKLFFERVLHE
ncbi:dethiobiotin synthase [Neobacillus kokaensis]|uniref:ATP-dependent dethiobiotin synthetase BioD n=1 Tax=Neobacillus kokaensis TaxID=2759023 RepID=A0ABQ3N1P1_9BACI|nr:dethiobiotin synthase [Neobacillus kokaensis]GHH97567.1 ATP-dependent dethiobiotin synthetase BioD [Neobacillus kokaensis]